jgi:hypothetical protein
MTETPVCSACGTPHDLRSSAWTGDRPICRKCFMLWYDTGITNTKELGAESNWRKSKGYWPWGTESPSTEELQEFRANLTG